MHLICRRCSATLSNELRLIGPSERHEVRGEDFLERGAIIQESGLWIDRRAGSYITHVDDAVHVRLTEDPKRLNGCCGLDGCDGPNLLCESCGAYVATKVTDCWRPHCVVFESTTTIAFTEAER